MEDVSRNLNPEMVTKNMLRRTQEDTSAICPQYLMLRRPPRVFLVV